MHVLGWIFFGLIVGIVARLLTPRHPHGFFATIILGILGALLGGWIGRVMGLYQEGQPAGFFMATLGAIILCVIYAMVFKDRTVS